MPKARRFMSILRPAVAVGVLVCAATLCQPATGFANLIVNGDFEIFVPSNSTGGGWTTFGGIDGSGGHRTTGGNPAGNFILNAGGQGGSDPTAQQDVSGLVVSATYRVEGDVACGNICDGTELSFGVLLDGVAILERTTPPSASVFEHFLVDFVATTATHTIGFAGERNSSDRDPRIDNISLECLRGCDVTVPGPATAVLLGSAMGALAVASRARKRKN